MIAIKNRETTRQTDTSLFREERAGSTLTEVLVAMLILSIGLVSVAALFPMSVLRSIKASQFTNATDLRFNAEAIMDAMPNLVRNPDQHLINPGTPQAAPDPSPHNGENFVVDPLGFAIINPSNNTLSQYFGNADPSDQALAPPPAVPPANPTAINPSQWTLRRYSGWPVGFALSEAAADNLVTLPDSWVLEFEGAYSNLQTDPKAISPPAGPTQIDVVGLGKQGLSLSATTILRVVIFSADGSTSQARRITGLGTGVPNGTVDTLTWTEDFDGKGIAAFPSPNDLNGNGVQDDYQLPPSFVANGIGKVRIEQQDRRYTWLLTVRKNLTGTSADVDVVVFFKRPFEEFQQSSKGYAGDEVLIQAVFTSGSTQVAVQYPIANKPFMRKGNYIFDANNAFWYRISNVSAATPGNNNTESVTITIDVPASAGNQVDPTKRPPRAMFPRAVVDVYPIGGKS